MLENERAVTHFVRKLLLSQRVRPEGTFFAWGRQGCHPSGPGLEPGTGHGNGEGPVVGLLT